MLGFGALGQFALGQYLRPYFPSPLGGVETFFVTSYNGKIIEAKRAKLVRDTVKHDKPAPSYTERTIRGLVNTNQAAAARIRERMIEGYGRGDVGLGKLDEGSRLTAQESATHSLGKAYVPVKPLPRPTPPPAQPTVRVMPQPMSVPRPTVTQPPPRLYVEPARPQPVMAQPVRRAPVPEYVPPAMRSASGMRVPTARPERYTPSRPERYVPSRMIDIPRVSYGTL